ncbi:hypothetical protein [Catellatospora sp. NPDC049609]|uniref:hypothetical protein n=1 Tax=Catellatospora sp. NPDC049609 TaxID=3155505 RepID=UPI0034305CCC
MTEQTSESGRNVPDLPAPAAVAGERTGLYLGLVSAAFPAILAGVRLFVLADGDDATMKALAQHTSMQALLIGSYLTFLPLILILAAALALTERRAAMRGAVSQTTALSSVPPPAALMIAAVGIVTAPLYLVVLLVAVIVLLVAAMTVGRRWPQPAWAANRPPSPLLGGRVPTVWVDALTALTGLTLAAVVLLQGMWLPASAVTVEGRTRVAYLLGKEDDLETVLFRDGGGPQQLTSDQITQRRLCSEHEAGPWDRPLLSLFVEPGITTSDVPLCRDLVTPGDGAVSGAPGGGAAAPR